MKEGLALAFVYVGPSEVPEYVLAAVSAARLQHSGPILLVVSLHALPTPNKKQEQESALEAWALQEHVRLFAAGPKHFTCFTSAACPPLRCRSECERETSVCESSMSASSLQVRNTLLALLAQAYK